MIRHNDITIDLARGSIEHRGASIFFRKGCYRGQLARRLILGGRFTADELFEFIYGQEEDGGPVYGSKAILVMLNHINMELVKIGLKVYSEPHMPRVNGSRKRHWIGPA